MGEGVKNALTFDIEEYFHAFRPLGMCPPETWHSYPSRVEASTHLILDVLDENSTKATFFVLGAVAERWPGLVLEIAKRGHEVATHGYGHELIYRQDRKQFREDVERAKAVLEDIISSPVTGYRAPAFSIIPQTAWAWDELAALGFKYDSSVFPIRGHDIYGFPEASPTPWVLHNGLAELPLTTTGFFGRNLPVGGGGYFRIYPYTITRWLLRRVNAKGRRGIIYLHPWELDPDQPRIRVSAKTRFRHYFGLRQTERRLHRLLQDFTLGPIREVFEDVLGSSSKQLT
jgi:polysaccharide deacetylase family protein (PEP-CTERM system associated)